MNSGFALSQKGAQHFRKFIPVSVKKRQKLNRPKWTLFALVLYACVKRSTFNDQVCKNIMSLLMLLFEMY